MTQAVHPTKHHAPCIRARPRKMQLFWHPATVGKFGAFQVPMIGVVVFRCVASVCIYIYPYWLSNMLEVDIYDRYVYIDAYFVHICEWLNMKIQSTHEPHLIHHTDGPFNQIACYCRSSLQPIPGLSHVRYTRDQPPL